MKSSLTHRAGIIAALVVISALVLYIMANGLGLDESLDFGAGAYYYADMPGFERWTDREFYISDVPQIVIFGLFFVWGAVIYRVWVKLDKGEK